MPSSLSNGDKQELLSSLTSTIYGKHDYQYKINNILRRGESSRISRYITSTGLKSDTNKYFKSTGEREQKKLIKKLKKLPNEDEFNQKKITDLLNTEKNTAESVIKEPVSYQKGPKHSTVENIGKSGSQDANVFEGIDSEGKPVRFEEWVDGDETHTFEGYYNQYGNREKGTHTIQKITPSEEFTDDLTGETVKTKPTLSKKEFTGEFENDTYGDGLLQETKWSQKIDSYGDKRYFKLKESVLSKKGETYTGNIMTDDQHNSIGDTSFGQFDKDENLKKGVKKVSTHPKVRGDGFETEHISYTNGDEKLKISREGLEPQLDVEGKNYTKYNKIRDSAFYRDPKTGDTTSISKTKDADGNLLESMKSEEGKGLKLIHTQKDGKMNVSVDDGFSGYQKSIPSTELQSPIKIDKGDFSSIDFEKNKDNIVPSFDFDPSDMDTSTETVENQVNTTNELDELDETANDVLDMI